MADEAFRQGVARIKRPADLRSFIEHRMWEPTKAHLNASTPFTSPHVTPQVPLKGILGGRMRICPGRHCLFVARAEPALQRQASTAPCRQAPRPLQHALLQVLIVGISLPCPAAWALPCLWALHRLLDSGSADMSCVVGTACARTMYRRTGVVSLCRARHASPWMAGTSNSPSTSHWLDWWARVSSAEGAAVCVQTCDA